MAASGGLGTDLVVGALKSPAVVFAALFLNSLIPAQGVTEELCLLGCPTGAPAADRIISRSMYVLSNNGETKFADWVAYRITPRSIAGSRRRSWKMDPAIPAGETLAPEDYWGAWEALQMDRGHQAPLASLSGSSDWKALNYLSNITPQRSPLNQGPWEQLEAAERSLTENDQIAAVYSATGTLYEHPMPHLPHATKPHTIPSGYWKVIAILQNGDLRAAAFITDQDAPRKAKFCAMLVTLGEVERRSHLTLFPQLSASARNQAESRMGLLSGSLGCPTGSVGTMQ